MDSLKLDTDRRIASCASAPHWPPWKRFSWMSSRTSNQAQQDASPTVAPLEQVARFSLTTAAASRERRRQRRAERVGQAQERTLHSREREGDGDRCEELLEGHCRLSADWGWCRD